MNANDRLQDAIRLAWHDVTCPEAEDCRDRSLHAASSPVADAILPRFLDRLEPEVAALRAKADATDRVRELAEDAAEMNDETVRSLPRLTDIKARHEGLRDAYRDAANHLRRALDGADRTDRGRC